MKTEHPLPHVAEPPQNNIREAEQRQMKMMDRSVRQLGGLRVLWSDHGQARHYLLPDGCNCPYSYIPCTCRKCEWVVGRQPLYASDVVRFYQSRHPEAVIIPIPPPVTCQEGYSGWPAKLKALCECPRCEESQGSHNDDGQNEKKLGCFDLTALSRYFQTGRAGTVTLLRRPAGAGQGVTHTRYEPPYNRGMYEAMGLPKPAAQWRGFGKPAVRRRLDFEGRQMPETQL